MKTCNKDTYPFFIMTFVLSTDNPFSIKFLTWIDGIFGNKLVSSREILLCREVTSFILTISSKDFKIEIVDFNLKYLKILSIQNRDMLTVGAKKLETTDLIG